MNEEMKFWRSPEDRAEGNVTDPHTFREFSPGDETLEMNEVDRRSFFGIMGASAALAGTAMTSGCVRKGVQHILPYTDRPEQLIPGEPMFYRTSWAVGDKVLGLHVESQDGRPTKVEGNPEHPLSGGATNTHAQASVLDLYDPDRIQKPRQGENEKTWDEAWVAFDADMAAAKGGAGSGLAVLMDGQPSPTRRRLIQQLRKSMPKTRFYTHDWSENVAAREGLKLSGLSAHSVSYDLSKAKVILSLDADCFTTDGDTVRLSQGYAAGRKIQTSADEMNRLYVVEGRFSNTGANADNRLRVPSSHVGEFLRALAGKVASNAPAGLKTEVSNRTSAEPGSLAHDARFTAFVDAVAKDLSANKGASAILVGERQPAWVHALALFVNDALGNTGKTVQIAKNAAIETGTLGQLTADIQSRTVSTLVLLDVNPVYDAPADVAFAEALKSVQTSYAFSSLHSETTALTTWALPGTHYLEAWGDLIANDGTVSVQQPLIAPLYWGVSAIEVLARMLGNTAPKGHDEVKKTLAGGSGQESRWQRMVHSGIAAAGKPVAATFNWSGLAPAMNAAGGPTRPSPGAMEVVFLRDPSVLDGRFGNNAWLQELPDPVTKVTWDNAVQLSPKTAKELQVQNFDVVKLTLGEASISAPVFITPGTADFVAVLPTGYGRTVGRVAQGAGVDVTPLRKRAAAHFAFGARVEATGETTPLATTQDHHTMVEPITGRKRPVVRETTIAEYRKDPNWVDKLEVMSKEKYPELKSLWEHPNNTEGLQWGMTIDLNACTGCNTCTIACQAENNIPVVGKERVAQGREMHWIRVDRYFSGSEDEPQAVTQPIPCMQCESAPCENVCPVAATVHSVDGLNDMAYNRCIGTRYCSNNCPFKVRRFNFFAYQKENEEMAPMFGMQKNPDVTIRFRGVMEKCTYCTQRISAAKIEAKRERQDAVVPDGRIVTACEQACPTGAIVFGNVNDPNSRVSKLKKLDRNYELLRELNLSARTTFLARVRNPNPDLV